MPIKIPDSLPATAVLESENIFVMTERADFESDAYQGNYRKSAASETFKHTASDQGGFFTDCQLYPSTCGYRAYGIILHDI